MAAKPSPSSSDHYDQAGHNKKALGRGHARARTRTRTTACLFKLVTMFCIALLTCTRRLHEKDLLRRLKSDSDLRYNTRPEGTAVVDDGDVLEKAMMPGGYLDTAPPNVTLGPSLVAKIPGRNLTNQQSSPPIFILVTEGGCSGTTAVFSYMRQIVKAHGIMVAVSYEFLSGNKMNPRAGKAGKFKNPYYHEMVLERSMARGDHDMKSKQGAENYVEMIMESIRRALADAEWSDSAFFFKAKVPDYERLRGRFDRDLHGASYAGLYRANALSRCICMVRDYFREAKGFGSPVFPANGTKTGFGRRFQKENVRVQARFTDAAGCLEEDQARIDFIKELPFDSFSTESLLKFQYSVDDDSLEAGIDLWTRFMKPLLKGKAERRLVAGVLEEGRGATGYTRSRHADSVYHYDEVKEDLLRADKTKWSVYLDD